MKEDDFFFSVCTPRKQALLFAFTLSCLYIAKKICVKLAFRPYIRPGIDTKGAKNQLLSDRAVARDSNIRKNNLCTAWVDCKKAYDSMQNTWILESFKLYNIKSH